MPRWKREAIFEARIERMGHADSEQSSISDEELRRIEEVVVRTLTVDLPTDLERLFGVEAEIHIKGTRYGSLSVFFGAVVGAYVILSRYKGFYESVELIRQQAKDLLKAALRRLGRFSVDVYTRYPSVRALESGWFRGLRKHIPAPFLAEFLSATWPPNEGYRPRRDGFFYFLLTLCIVELVVIGLLVYGAVMKTYF